MAAKESIRKEDLLDVPLICSRQVMTQRRTENEFADWFGDDFDRLHVVTTFNLVYNAGHYGGSRHRICRTLDKLAHTSEDSPLCFRPLMPPLSRA